MKKSHLFVAWFCTLIFVGLALCETTFAEVLFYDDGFIDRSVAPGTRDPGSQIAVRFTASNYPVKLENVQFYITRYSEPSTQFEIRIYDDDNGDFPGTRLDQGKFLGAGVAGNEWVSVDLSSQSIWIEEGSFFVAMYWTKATYLEDHVAQRLGLDSSEPISGRTSWKTGYSGDWYFRDVASGLDGDAMIRATVTTYTKGDYDYYLPYYSSADNCWTGLGLVNRNQENPANLQVIVYDSNGNSLATENKTIPAYGQDAYLVATQLSDSGWMWVNSHQPLAGLAFLGSGSLLSLMADIPFISELSTSLVVPHIAQDISWDTTILICNPNDETVFVVLKYVDKAGVVQGTQNYTILAHGSGEYLLSTIFSDKIPLAGRIEINSSTGIAAFALYKNQKSGGTYYAGINAESCE